MCRWKFKIVQTFFQHFIFYFSCELMLDMFARSPNMFDQHSCKKDINFIEIGTTLRFKIDFTLDCFCPFLLFWNSYVLFIRDVVILVTPQVKMLSKSTTKRGVKEMIELKKQQVGRWQGTCFDWTFRRGNSCLWDIYSSGYTEREQREKAYTELAEHFWDNVSECQI